VICQIFLVPRHIFNVLWSPQFEDIALTFHLLTVLLVSLFAFEHFPSMAPPWHHSSPPHVHKQGPWAVCLRIEGTAMWGPFGGFLRVSKCIDSWEPGKFPVSCSWDSVVCAAHGLLTILLFLMFAFERSL